MEIKDHLKRLDLTIRRFEKLVGFKVGKVTERFSCGVNFNYLKKAEIDGRLYVGEAAGFQDGLAGFGMLYAFMSGYYAAQSIIDKKDYNILWRKDFLNTLQVGFSNRKTFDKLSNQQLELGVRSLKSKRPWVKFLRGGDDLRKILKRYYTRKILRWVRPLTFVWK
jgi:flavin-dependent dehydrogenase